MTLQQAGTRAGGHQWLEEAVWRLLGGWAATTGEAAAAVLFDTHAQHAAWRARQWGARLPVLAGIERDGLVRPPSAGLSAVVERLGGEGAPGTVLPGTALSGTVSPGTVFPGTVSPRTVSRLAAAYRVLLPRLVAGYRREAGLLSPVSDAPALRTLAQVDSDAAGDWVAGETFLQGILVDGAAVNEAAATVAGLELLLAAGNPAGEAME